MLFRTVARGILCNIGSTEAIGGLISNELSGLTGKAVLIVTDPGLVQVGLVDKCISSIESAGLRPIVYSNVYADPTENCVYNAVDMAKNSNAIAVCGFGGGSSLDVAKLAAFFSHHECRQELYEVYGVDKCFGKRLPLVQVPTTAGTGSEVTPISIITTGNNEKMGIVSPLLLPDWAVLDGSLTKTLPASFTAATGIDAMVHAIEAYTSKLKKNDLSDMLSKQALRLLSSNVLKVTLEDPEDLEARSNMLLGSLYAGMAFANAPVAAVHALAYPIGSHFKVPHGKSIDHLHAEAFKGLSNALMLPHVLEFNMQSKLALQQYQEIAPIIFPVLERIVDEDFAPKFVEQVRALISKLGIAENLGSVGVKHEDIMLLAEEAMHQTRLLQNNPVDVKLKDAIDLYEKAL